MESATCLSSCSVVLRYLVSSAGAIHGEFPLRLNNAVIRARDLRQTAVHMLALILNVTSGMIIVPKSANIMILVNWPKFLQKIDGLIMNIFLFIKKDIPS